MFSSLFWFFCSLNGPVFLHVFVWVSFQTFQLHFWKPCVRVLCHPKFFVEPHKFSTYSFIARQSFSAAFMVHGQAMWMAFFNCSTWSFSGLYVFCPLGVALELSAILFSCASQNGCYWLYPQSSSTTLPRLLTEAVQLLQQSPLLSPAWWSTHKNC